MKKFQTVVENALKQTQLMRVRLKVDPANCSDGEIVKYNGYEGYILAEEDGIARVYVECEGASSVISVPQAMIDIQDTLTSLDKLKLAALRMLKASNKLDKESAAARVIANANSPEALEQYLAEVGLDVDGIKNLYKQLVFDNII